MTCRGGQDSLHSKLVRTQRILRTRDLAEDGGEKDRGFEVDNTLNPTRSGLRSTTNRHTDWNGFTQKIQSSKMQNK